MAGLTQLITIQSDRKKQVIDITDRIEALLDYTSGLCHLFIKHTTAALTTADLDPGTDLDMLDAFEAMMPKLKYRHPHNPDHAPDHILSSIIGPALTIPVDAGELILGTWQRVVLIELDGPRVREIVVTTLTLDRRNK
jgi:secondary thiamine-phosphate synthase enzyme